MKRYKYVGGGRIIHGVSEARLDDVERELEGPPYVLEPGDVMKLSDSEYEVLSDRFEPIEEPDLPAEIKEIGGGWYEVNGEKVRGLEKALDTV